MITPKPSVTPPPLQLLPQSQPTNNNAPPISPLPPLLLLSTPPSHNRHLRQIPHPLPRRARPAAHHVRHLRRVRGQRGAHRDQHARLVGRALQRALRHARARGVERARLARHAEHPRRRDGHVRRHCAESGVGRGGWWWKAGRGAVGAPEGEVAQEEKVAVAAEAEGTFAADRHGGGEWRSLLTGNVWLWPYH